MTGFTNVFGGENVNPTLLSYTSILLNGTPSVLQWNLPGDQNTPVGTVRYPAASKIDLPSINGGSVVMPDATLVTPGQDILFNNLSPYDTVVYANDGVTQIVSMPTGTAWFVYLIDNSTVNGTWRTVQYGAATSTANASTLAGSGLFAAANTLNQEALWSTKNANYAVTAADRATSLANIGGSIAFTFAASATLTSGWFAFFRNNGSGTLTLTAAGGNTIDGAATKALAAGESCIIVADGVTSLNSIGYGRLLTSSTTAAIINAAGTGTITLNVAQIAAAVQTFSGTLTGDRIIEYGTGVGYWFVFNTTAGAFSTTFRVNGADPGVAVVQGNYAILRSDGTTMALAFSATSGTVTSVGTGAGLTGGPITSTGTIAMANSGVTAGTYGDSATVAQIVVDVLGRVTSATSLTIAAAWAAITGIPAAITALGSLTPAADMLGYFTGSTTAALTALTAYARSLLAATNAAAARVLITPLTTNGDIWYYAGGVDARLAAGAVGTVLTGAGAGVVPAWAAPSTPFAPLQNRFINGDFAIDQRNEGASQTYVAGTGIAYSVDRWYGACTGTNLTGQRATGTAPNQYGYTFAGAGSNTGLLYGQRFESANVADLVSGNATCAIQLKSSSITTVTWTAYYANAADDFSVKTLIATGTLTINSTLAPYNFTFNTGANAANGIAIEFSCGALLVGQTLHFENASLQAGSVAGAFERKNINDRLIDCQRYYRKSYALGTALAASTHLDMVTGGCIYVAGSEGGLGNVSYPQMRAAPAAVNYWDGAGAANKVSYTPSSSSSYIDGATASIAPFNLSANGFGYQGYTGASCTSWLHYAVSVEL